MADNPGSADQLIEARDAGTIEVLVVPEAAHEIRNTPDPERRAQLEAVLSRFFPLTPTRVPRVGTARVGLARLPTPEDESRLAAVEFLRDGQDRNLVTNAAGYRCDVFVTDDGEMAKRKLKRLEAHLGGTRVIRTKQFLAELKQLARQDAAEQ